jgi:hypothetical protein
VNPSITRAAMSKAPDPESRTTARPALPGAVASAAIGSDSMRTYFLLFVPTTPFAGFFFIRSLASIHCCGILARFWTA